MEGLASETPFAQLVAGALGDHLFTVLDIGCSGGIHPAWRVFGERLRAYAFDPNIEEVERLRERETHPGVTYVPRFAGLPAEAPAYGQWRQGDFWARNPWSRLSVVRSQEIQARLHSVVSSREKTTLNLWSDVELADPEEPVIIPSFLAERGVDDIDFIKIDVDGADFLLLRSLTATLGDMKVSGVGIEVNFFGSGDPDVNTFHNVDRLMKEQGFELFLLSTRPYSVAALPAPYQFAVPAQTAWGRILQGDAIYFRDAAVPENEGWVASAGEYKLLKLAGLLSLAGLPDCAAEILVRFRQLIEPVVDVDACLEALVLQLPAGRLRPASYARYLAEFEADADYFYPARGGHTDAATEATPQAGGAPTGGSRPQRMSAAMLFDRLFGRRRRS
jgi:hypothetical protein